MDSTSGRVTQLEGMDGAQPISVIKVHAGLLNPVLRLYQRLGFEMIEDTEGYLLMEWKK